MIFEVNSIIENESNGGRMKMDKKTAITISRQFGSGGHEIGELLAQRLGIHFIDREVVTETAKTSDIAQSVIESMDEKPTTSFLYSLVMGLKPGKLGPDEYDMPLPQKVFHAEYNTIRRIAAEKSAVFVGRCADYALKDTVRCVRIFIYAPLDARIRRIDERMKVDRDRAAELIEKADKNRASYYTYYTGNKWGRAENYDICISSALCGTEGTVDSLERIVKNFLDAQ